MVGFRAQHPSLALRTAEATSVARAQGSNRPNGTKLFDLLEGLFDQHPYSPSRIYNCDETGVSTVQTMPNKVMGLKGQRQIGRLTSVERGTRITVELCMNTVGENVPPLIIFPRVRMKA